MKQDWKTLSNDDKARYVTSILSKKNCTIASACAKYVLEIYFDLEAESQ